MKAHLPKDLIFRLSKLAAIYAELGTEGDARAVALSKAIMVLLAIDRDVSW
mgnify:CR=1 FL=1